MTDNNNNSEDGQLPKLWSLIDRGSNENLDAASKQQMHQMYSGVAELYHEVRPKYPEALIDEALQKAQLTKHAKILELGCGPGTLTSSLAKRGYQITALDPGLGMVEKARQVCQEYSNVEFRQESFKDFESCQKYDAIVAASSLHWALADSDKTQLIAKLATLLNDNGSLLLFWNFPPEPSEDILNKVADALQKPKPFYFGHGNLKTHWNKLTEHVLEPIEASSYFVPFETIEYPVQEHISIESYIQLLNTLSLYITLPDEEREAFFEVVRRIFRQECGERVPMARKSILNVSSKPKG